MLPEAEHALDARVPVVRPVPLVAVSADGSAEQTKVGFGVYLCFDVSRGKHLEFATVRTVPLVEWFLRLRSVAASCGPTSAVPRRKVADDTILLRHNQAVEPPIWYIITPFLRRSTAFRIRQYFAFEVLPLL